MVHLCVLLVQKESKARDVVTCISLSLSCRKELPHDVIQRALVVTALFPPVALQGLFQLTSLQDEPVLVLLLRLELLWDRLPAGKRAELSVLPCLLHNAG